MSRVSLSLRLTRAQDAALRRYADAHGVVRYQAAIRAVEAGLAALVGGGPTRSDQPSAETADALGELIVRVHRLEQMTDRTLFTSAAAYQFSRKAALRGESDPAKVDQALGEAAGEAYRRQRDLARGEP
jgi:hypothetical protein